jgi:LysR family transcriptional activator of nhaA
LHYFWVVAKEGHLTRAAQALHVSQSALSSQIRQLEEQLGHQLFEREGRSLQLTESGRLVLSYADSIFSLGSELLASLRQAQSATVHSLRLGSVATLSRNFQENLLRPLLEEGNTELVLESASLEELLGRLQVHKLDVVLSNRPVAAASDSALRCKRISRQSVCLVGPKPAAGRFRFPHGLQGHRVILPGRSSDIRAQFDVLCEELGLEIRPFAEVDDMALLRLLARDSGALALVPEVVVQDELQNGRLHKLCVVPEVFENFYAITAKRQFQPPALKQLLARLA